MDSNSINSGAVNANLSSQLQQCESNPLSKENATVQKKDKYIAGIFHNYSDYSIDRELVTFFQHEFLEKIKTPPDKTEIDLWMDSPGGDLHSAYKLILAFRAHCSFLRIVIPDCAKSAATLIAIGGDEIYMGACAELGPLDAQIMHPDREDKSISAMDIANALDNLLQKSIITVLKTGGAVIRTTKIARKDTLSLMLEFTAKFMNPIVSKLDPALVHNATNALKVADDYCERLLKNRIKIIQTTDMSRAKLLEKLPKTLIQDYSSHGFVISRDEARDLGLTVLDIETYDFYDDIIKYWFTIETSGNSSTFFKKQEEIADIIKKMENA